MGTSHAVPNRKVRCPEVAVILWGRRAFVLHVSCFEVRSLRLGPGKLGCGGGGFPSPNAEILRIAVNDNPVSDSCSIELHQSLCPIAVFPPSLD